MTQDGSCADCAATARAVDTSRGRRLEYLTIGWNVTEALAADSRQTSLCAYLSAILLGGLALNAWQGWWWADPVAALVMVPIILREGLEALRGEACSDCH